MQGFPGFPDGKLATVPVPEQFFTDLLPAIEHVAELKVTAYALWKLHYKEGRYRFLTRDDFARDDAFMRGLSTSPRQAQEALDDALERAEARGSLLPVIIEDAQSVSQLYFMNTARGREAVEKLTSGEWRPAHLDGAAITLGQARSNVFNLYEQNIGPLTPMIAEELRDLQATYPAAWIEDAIRVAVRNNVRRLKYVVAVLERMRAEGRNVGTAQTPEEDLSRYDGYLPYAANAPESDDEAV